MMFSQKVSASEDHSLDGIILREFVGADVDETQFWLAAADRVLKELWDNDEDAVYDEVERGADHGTRSDDSA